MLRTAFRALNSALKGVGLKLERHSFDFDARPEDDFCRALMIEELAAGFERWVRAQTLFTPAPTMALPEQIDRFYFDWLRSPFRSRTGGSRLNNLLWLFLLARAYDPKVIIDSGTFQGASAWALARGAPAAQVFSFDIDMSELKQRTKGVRYIEADWIDLARDWDPENKVLAYFDDHVNQARRLIEAADRGVGLLIFDDDYPLTSFHQMAPSPSVLPKIEFLLAPHLKDGQTLQWRYGGKVHTWTVDGALLDNARSRIKATERLPFTGLITNIMQTPYRLVVPQ